MFPVLWSYGPLRLYGYGAAITFGAALTAWLMWRMRERAGLRDEESFWALVNVSVLSGFLGGKLLFVLQYGLGQGFSVMGGYSAFGGFISVPLAIWAFASWKKISFLNLFDHMLVLCPFWHAFGRLGCFLAGCCYGRPTELPWGVVFRNTLSQIPPELLGVRIHPVQIYEAAGDLVISYGLYRLMQVVEKKRLAPGLVVASYFAAYGVLRFSLEFLRGDDLPLLGALTQGQGLGLGLIAASGALLYWRNRCSPS